MKCSIKEVVNLFVAPVLLSECRCRTLEFQLIKFNDKHTLGTTPLDEGSVRRRGHHPRTIHNRQTSIPTDGFEPTIPASEPPQTCALDRAATGIGECVNCQNYLTNWHVAIVKFY